MARALLDKTLIYVTGKGGVGKTTVCAALGMAASERGRRTIVVEVAEQRHMSEVFHTTAGEEEVRLDEDLYAISIDPQHALQEWLGRQVGGAALKVLTRSQAFQYFVAAAPGAKELITIAKVWEIAQGQRWTKTNRTYDTVIVDAPASGHGLAMLRTPSTFGDIARVGPIQRQAYKVRDMLRDREHTGYVAVALPEEMPVTETLELQDRIAETVDAGLDAIVVNAVYPERFEPEETERLRDLAGRDGHVAWRTEAVRAAVAAADRARDQRVHVRRLKAGTEAPVVTLPYLFEEALGLDEYRELAERLTRRLDEQTSG